jgi:hypothetical protein
LHIALSQKQSRFKFNMVGLSWWVFADEIFVDKFQCFNLKHWDSFTILSLYRQRILNQHIITIKPTMVGCSFSQNSRLFVNLVLKLTVWTEILSSQVAWTDLPAAEYFCLFDLNNVYNLLILETMIVKSLTLD